jgi:hypothetical protein
MAISRRLLCIDFNPDLFGGLPARAAIPPHVPAPAPRLRPASSVQGSPDPRLQRSWCRLSARIAGVPSSFCQRMSALPSPLKSPMPATCQLGPGFRQTPAPNKAGTVHQPDRGRPVIILPENVVVAVAIEVAGAYDLPARSRVRQTPPPAKLVPFISQIAGVPSSFRHR